MRYYFSGLLILVFSFFARGQQWKNFKDSAGRFTARYPASWVNKTKEGNRVFFTSPVDNAADQFYENININITRKEGYGTAVKIKDLFPTVTNSIKKEFLEFKEESLRYFKWNNSDAAELIYSGYSKLDSSIKIRTTQWYCFNNSRLYMATFVAAAGNNLHNGTARKIMSSIVFK